MSLTISVSEIVDQSTSELLGKHKSWERVELASIANVLNGFAFNSAYFSKNKGIPLIRIRDICNNFTETYYNNSYDELYLVTLDDLLVGMDGDFNCALWKGEASLLNQRVCKIQVYQEKLFSQKFLYYVLPGYLKAINDVTSSTTVKHLSSKSVEEIPLPLPPIPEQLRIVSAIEQQFTRLDSAVASLKSAKARIKQYRASLLKSAVEGELTKEWRAEHPVSETGEQLLARILQERRARWEEEQLRKMSEKGIVSKDDTWKAKYEEPQRPDVENLPELPKGWCWGTFEQISSRVTVGYVGSMAQEYVDSGVPFLRSQNVRPNYFDSNGLKYISLEFHYRIEKSALESGDILVVRSGSVGVACVMPNLYEKANCSDLVIVKKPVINSTYATYYMNSTAQNRVRSQQVGIALNHFNTQSMAIFPVPIPSLAEQEQIVAEVEARLSNIAQLEATTENSLKRAERDRQSILQEAFAGRLVPQDLNDEPASILLERIREERKKREEAEKLGKVSRKGSSMDAAKKRRAKKVAAGEAGSGLYEVLLEAGEPLRPEEVFRVVGLKAEDQPESVETFYVELRDDVADGLVGVTRPDTTTVLLEALDAPAEEEEEAVHIDLVEDVKEEEELAELLQKEDEKLPSEWPTLWDELDNA